MAASSSNAAQAPTPCMTDRMKILATYLLQEVFPRLLVQKVLCHTDISRRLVLPKNEVEANMPLLAVNETRPIQLYDYLTGSFWEFFYRCWESPSGKIKSYYIERTGEYFWRHGLIPKDKVMIYQEETGILTIRFERGHAPVSLYQFRDRFHSLIKDESWVYRPRYSEIYPLPVDDTSELDLSFSQAMEPIPSRDKPTTSPDPDWM